MAIQKFEITQAEGGTAVLVQVNPDAPQNRITGNDSDIIYVDLDCPAEREAVDEALQVFFAKILGVGRGNIAVTSGKSVEKKIVVILGRTPEAVEARLTGQ